MDQDERVIVFAELDIDTASETLEEMAPPIQREIVSALTREKAVAIIDEMTPDQAPDILSTFSPMEVRDILIGMTIDNVKKVKTILNSSEENISITVLPKSSSFPLMPG